MSNTLIFFLILVSIPVFILVLGEFLCLLINLFCWIMSKWIEHMEKGNAAIEKEFGIKAASQNSMKNLSS